MEWMASVDLSTPKLVDLINYSDLYCQNTQCGLCTLPTSTVSCFWGQICPTSVYSLQMIQIQKILSTSSEYTYFLIHCVYPYPIWSEKSEHESRIQTTSHSTTVGSTRESPKYKQRIDIPKHPQSCPNNKQLIIYFRINKAKWYQHPTILHFIHTHTHTQTPASCFPPLMQEMCRRLMANWPYLGRESSWIMLDKLKQCIWCKLFFYQWYSLRMHMYTVCVYIYIYAMLPHQWCGMKHVFFYRIAHVKTKQDHT